MVLFSYLIGKIKRGRTYCGSWLQRVPLSYAWSCAYIRGCSSLLGRQRTAERAMQKEVRIQSSPQGEQLHDLLPQLYPTHLHHLPGIPSYYEHFKELCCRTLMIELIP